MSAVIVQDVTTTVVDLPFRRPHTFSTATADHQSYVVVQVTSVNGIEGIGEGAAPGGPWWGAATIEAIQAVIDLHLAPALVGLDARALEHVHQVLKRVAPAERSARSALEMALLDLVGKNLDVPAHQLLGGQSRTSVPVAWALSARGADAQDSEVDERLADGHRRFKLKAGAAGAQDDIDRAVAVLAQLDGRADLVVDPNGAWDEITARRTCAQLADAGVALVEQPVAGWNLEALSRLSDQTAAVVMADEAVQTPHDAFRAACLHAAPVWSLKPQKAGGPREMLRVAAVAHAAGVRVYGGTMLESSIGTAAALHVLAALPDVHEGCELVGPLLLADDLTEIPVAFRDGEALVPEGPGLGVTLDEERLAQYTRAGASAHVTA